MTSIDRCLSNRLDFAAVAGKSLAGVIGDSPSLYSKSPQLWNAAFRRLGLNAIYVALDVAENRLGELLSALKEHEEFIGVNVTVPHKAAVMRFLDAVDPAAERIHAVNTVVRTPAGKLTGYNTDGEGFVDSVLKRQPDRPASFLASLEGVTVIVLGAGGSARAVAFHLADHIGGGKILICNRTAEHAASLAREIHKAGSDALSINEEQLSLWAPKAGLIVNCTTKGQGGLRRLPNGGATCLEPYSALASAHPPVLAAREFEQAGGRERWRAAARADIEANNQASMTIAASALPGAGFCDLIYHPEETVFLRHGRSTGHPTLNGKAMIINQAVRAFCLHICAPELRARAIDTPETYANEILKIMYAAW